MVSLSIIIPTHDGEGLDRCLASIAPQLGPDDEVAVILDTHGLADEGDTFVSQWEHLMSDERMMVLGFDAGYHGYGHPQRCFAQDYMTRGDYLVHIDDDDELLPGALNAIRAAIEEQPGRPHMFRFLAPFGLVMPRAPVVAEGNVGGTGFVTPNDPTRLGRWSDRYQGDYDYITSTLAHYRPNALVWHDTMIARCAVGDMRLWFNLVTTPAEVEAMRVIRNAGRDWMTHNTSEISPQQQARWWAERDPERVWAWLAMHGHDVLGYGLLTWRQGRWWGSLAVKPEERGRGIGTAIYRHLIDQCPDDLWIDIRSENAASLAAARRAGFAGEMTLRDGTITLVAHKKVAALV